MQVTLASPQVPQTWRPLTPTLQTFAQMVTGPLRVLLPVLLVVLVATEQVQETRIRAATTAIQARFVLTGA